MRLTGKLRQEAGFTMPAVLGAMVAVMLMSIAALAAAGGDIGLARYDQDDKQAYAAAEAGVNDYLAHLNTDTNFWKDCTGVPAPTPVNQPSATATSTPARKWRDVPKQPASEYSITLLPAPGKTACDPADPVGSMINDGNLRIRATGRVKGTNNYRSIVATFRRTGFLDFIYFTDFENQDPAYAKRQWGDYTTVPTDASGNPVAGPDALTWASDKCERHWWGTQSAPGGDQGRKELPTWRGYVDLGGGQRYPAATASPPYLDVTTESLCTEIRFADADVVAGPFHSNDDILICGTPEFGRLGGADKVEVSGDGWRSDCSGSAPVFRPSLTTSAPQLDLPPSNSSLSGLALPGYSFKGNTTITLDGANMTVTNPNLNGGSPTTMAQPSNGVVYVANGACGSPYNPTKWDVRDPECGDVRLQGTYSKDLTIAAQNDIIITGNTTRSTNEALLGLIPDGFARIWHPVDANCQNMGSPTNIQLDAAVLTVTGSFTVDNYWCGAPLGTLTVRGAIAQSHRGVVGTGAPSGYIKNYQYNEALKFRSPPYFLDPVQASWRILRQGEQSPPQR